MGKENVQIQMEFHIAAQKMTFLGKCIMLKNKPDWKDKELGAFFSM